MQTDILFPTEMLNFNMCQLLIFLIDYTKVKVISVSVTQKSCDLISVVFFMPLRLKIRGILFLSFLSFRNSVNL